MNKKEKFEAFLENLKGNNQDELIETVKQGFQSCFEGYAMVYSSCGNCGKSFGFNPNYVPSIRDTSGVKQPICKPCIEWANVEREKRGIPTFPAIHPQAYEALPEEEL